MCLIMHRADLYQKSYSVRLFGYLTPNVSSAQIENLWLVYNCPPGLTHVEKSYCLLITLT